MKAKIIFSRIKKHPLNNSYLLYCPIVCIPPYIGSKKECINVQITFEKKIQHEFFNLPTKEKYLYIELLCKKYGYKKESFNELFIK